MCAKTIKKNESFICLNCREEVLPAEKTCRNHCPLCLWSLHVDDIPGDRACSCRGLMEPIKLEDGKKGFSIVHRCTSCKMVKRNKVLPDDDWDKVIELTLS